MTDPLSPTSARRATLVLERTYRATLGDVWDLWTTKEGFESWWGPEGFRVEVAELDARVGGALRYEMIADAPAMRAEMERQGQPPSHPVTSQFSVFVPQERLELTNVIDFLPGVPPYESHILVDLAALGDRVTMRITLDALHDETFTKMQLAGVTSQLRKLDARFPA